MIEFLLGAVLFAIVGYLTLDLPLWKTLSVIVLTVTASTLIRVSGVV